MKFYAVREYNKDIYITDNVDMALHEMISIINSRIKVFSDNQYQLVDKCLSDIMIEEYLDAKGKSFRYVLNKYSFSTKPSDHIICTPVLAVAEVKNYKLQEFLDTPFCIDFLKNIKTLLHPTATPKPISNLHGSSYLGLTGLSNNTMELPKQTNLNSEINTNSLIPTATPETPTPEANEDVDSKIKKIKEKIEELKNIKSENKNKINNLRLTQDKQSEALIDYSSDVNYIKKKICLEKEKEEEKRNKFNADKRAYLLMKEDITKGELKSEKISPLFKDKYPIFEYLDTTNLLTKSNDETCIGEDYFIYNELLERKQHTNNEDSPKSYLPHNYHYLSEEEQNKFGPALTKRKDLIEKFLSKKKKLKPLNQILAELDKNELGASFSVNDSDSDTENISDDTDEDSDVPDIDMSSINNATNNYL